ncbi:carbohydrate binding family 9 domain-containing protein [Cyclobacterium qasimii]|nr:carbohydrate binding family 9 domain-containing protein [Cyclobacterium qasimii]
MSGRKSLILFFSCFFLLFGLYAQQPRDITAYRLVNGEHINLDGRIDESFWAKVHAATAFRQQEPLEGQLATEQTSVQIAFDEKNLYIGARFYDSQPDEIKAFQKRRDASLDTDDKFAFILDTYNDQRSAFYFEINPHGLMGDGILRTGQGAEVNRDWNGIWRVWVTRDDKGWSAEIRIPFMTLNFDPKNETWGINFLRTIRRKNEITLWEGFKRNQGIERPQDAGKLRGLSNINQGIGLEAIPYAITTQSRLRDDPEGSMEKQTTFNAGGELNYNITPNLKAGITVNTDFAEAEVDDRQVNLTRFPIVLPERRDFFLQGANVFVFAPSSNPTPYFSRKIGLQDGRAIPIKHGARLIGRIKNTDIGFLQARTGESGGLPGENFTVGRVLQNISAESTIGAIYTRRDTDGDSLPVRETFGADINLSTSKFFGDKNFQFEAFFVGHSPSFFSDSSSIMDRSVRGFRFNFPNQPWDAHISYREFGVNYDPAVGFVPRVGFRRLQPTITYNPLIERSSILRELSWQYDFEYLMMMNWKPATVNHEVRVLGLRFETGDFINFSFLHNYEFLDFTFDILRDGAFLIPEGTYQNRGHSIEASSAPFRKFGGTATFTNIGFWTGRQVSLETDVFVRPFVGLNMTASYIHSSVHLEQGDFKTHLLRLNSSYDFSQWVSMNFNIQYDNLTERLGTNSRFIWVIDPGNTFFIVHNHNWQRFTDRFNVMEIQSTVKLAYTLRF